MAYAKNNTLLSLLNGAGFGTGYGAGVRFGYEDVYPSLKSGGQKLWRYFEDLGLFNSNLRAGYSTGNPASSPTHKYSSWNTGSWFKGW